MNQQSQWHTESARSTIQFLRYDSPDAAAALSQILTVFGAKAAYHASVALVQLKTDVERHGEAKPLAQYENEMLEFENALPLFRRALRAVLIDYAMGIKQDTQRPSSPIRPFTQGGLPTK